MKSLRVVPCNQEIFAQFAASHQARGGYQPPAHGDGVWVVDGDTGAFVCGVQLFTSDGPYIFAEDLTVAEGVSPRRARLAAVELCVHHAVAFAAMKGKWLRATVRSSGLRMVLKKMGFRRQRAIPMFIAPSETFPLKEKPRRSQPVGAIPMANAESGSRTQESLSQGRKGVQPHARLKGEKNHGRRGKKQGKERV